MSKFNLCGKKFTRLLVLEFAPKYKTKVMYKCICDCGTIKIVRSEGLLNGNTKSCGCLQLEYARGPRKHGLSKHKLYKVWTSMNDRCYKENSTMYKHYGGRGISICQEWKDDYVCFYNWAILNGWAKGLQIDRENNDGNYCPENCRFVTPTVNLRNTRRNVFIELNGEIKNLSAWAEIGKMSIPLLRRRLRTLSIGEALIMPKRKQKNNSDK